MQEDSVNNALKKHYRNPPSALEEVKRELIDVRYKIVETNNVTTHDEACLESLKRVKKHPEEIDTLIESQRIFIKVDKVAMRRLIEWEKALEKRMEEMEGRK